MDEPRARIYDDLRGLIEGDLLFEPVQRAPYAVDASLYEIDPLGVVVPRGHEDLVTTVRYAAEHGLPLHPRGAGTGLAGESLGPGLVLDLSRHFRRIVEVRPESVVVQAGAVLADLNRHLSPFGRQIGPDPSGADTCTLGGMIGGNAAGAHSLRYGTTADHVERLRVVFAHGETAEVGNEPRPIGDDDPEDFTGRVVRKLATLLDRHDTSIARGFPSAPRNRCGYALQGVASPTGIDLARLLVGSEGTLAVVTEATLRTVPVPAARAVTLLPFRRLGDAAVAVMDCLAERPSACELLDWRSLALIRDAEPAYRSWIPDAAEAVLVVEFQGDESGRVAHQARALAALLARSGTLAADPVEVTRRDDCERLVRLREVVRPLLMRMQGPARPVPLIEDIAVPPAQISLFLGRLQQVLKGYEVNWLLSAHAGHGQLHIRPFLNLANPRDVAKLEPMATEVYEAALDLGGTISGEHGCGLVRTQFVRRQYGELTHVFREIKNIFDPQDLLNPGKIVGDDPHLMTRHLRSWPAPAPVQEPEPEEAAEAPAEVSTLPILSGGLRWLDGSREEQTAACNGCGSCRSREPSLRMCPAFRATRSEGASPRAKVNVLRQLAAGTLDPKLWGTEALKPVADLCVHCELCRSECPAGIDISGLMLDVKAAFVENHGLSTTDWVFSRVDLWARIGSRLPLLSNALMSSPTVRRLLEWGLGLSRLRLLPRVHRGSFVGRADRLGLTRPRPQTPGPRVAYFVDTFTNFFDPELAEATVSLLRHAGVNVFVPRRQRGSGRTALLVGDLDHARDQALANLRVLGNAVRDGYTIVCSEPTATLMLRREYLRLTDDLDAALVAENTMDVGQYLTGLDARGQWPAPEVPLHARVGYHQPCHLRALEIGTPGLDLIRRIPGLTVEFIDRGCSGMAGSFGMTREHFRDSLRAGRGLLNRLRDADLNLGATECGSCRMQMEQGSPLRTLHPLKLLSLSYGLDPNLRRHLQDPRPRRRLS